MKVFFSFFMNLSNVNFSVMLCCLFKCCKTGFTLVIDVLIMRKKGKFCETEKI